ncbi:MAG: hypothetical protein FJ191_09530 [Gammaproteobacteria bacterium]|nr:hypothetical protein [Gammaproteobacteria bacterium]
MKAIRKIIATLPALLLAGCAATQVETRAGLPPPLVERLPLRVGVYYPREFREYVHKEKRQQIGYEVALGAAHVGNLDWLFAAMFDKVVPLEDVAQAAAIRPPLAMVLEPRFEEYSFLTPRDVAGEAYLVTIRYLLTVYDGAGARVDGFAYTGYGREPAHGLSASGPLQAATQRAMRDAAAKVAVELMEQDSVRLLLRASARPESSGPAPVPVPGPLPVPSLPRS